MRWDGSVCYITGASRGIGRALAIDAAKRGARVGLIARSKDELDELLASCDGKGAVATADVGERAQVEDAVEELTRSLGPADILVNNAGIGAYGRFDEADVNLIERMMRVNFLGSVYATKAVLPSMLDRRRGHIVNVASIAGRIGAPLEAAYSASKFAMAGWSEALAMELTNKGIGVSMIHPGPVRTSFFEARGVPYQRDIPKPVSAERVAGLVIRAVERNRLETYVPRWLRMATVIKAMIPPAYRAGAMRDYRKDLG